MRPSFHVLVKILKCPSKESFVVMEIIDYVGHIQVWPEMSWKSEID